MSAILVGYVLHALACSQAEPHRCVELPTRSAPTALYVCQSSQAIAIQRVSAIDPASLGLSGPQHFTFSCQPAFGDV